MQSKVSASPSNSRHNRAALGLSTLLKRGCDFFKAIVKAITSVVKSIVNAVVRVVKAIWNAIVAVVKWIVSAIKAIWDWIVDLFDGIWIWILAIIIIIILIFCPYLANLLWEFIMYIWEWFMALDWVQAVASWFDVLTTVYDLGGFWSAAGWVVSEIGGWIASAFMAIGSWISAAGDWLASAAGSIWDVAKSVGGAIGSAASWAAGLLADNPGLLALGAAAATGLLGWLADNWQIVALGGAAYLMSKGSGSGTKVIIQEPQHAPSS